MSADDLTLAVRQLDDVIGRLNSLVNDATISLNHVRQQGEAYVGEIIAEIESARDTVAEVERELP